MSSRHPTLLILELSLQSGCNYRYFILYINLTICLINKFLYTIIFLLLSINPNYHGPLSSLVMYFVKLKIEFNFFKSFLLTWRKIYELLGFKDFTLNSLISITYVARYYYFLFPAFVARKLS